MGQLQLVHHACGFRPSALGPRRSLFANSSDSSFFHLHQYWSIQDLYDSMLHYGKQPKATEETINNRENLAAWLPTLLVTRLIGQIGEKEPKPYRNFQLREVGA